jgi:hypothetical protein
LETPLYLGFEEFISSIKIVKQHHAIALSGVQAIREHNGAKNAARTSMLPEQQAIGCAIGPNVHTGMSWMPPMCLHQTLWGAVRQPNMLGRHVPCPLAKGVWRAHVHLPVWKKLGGHTQV